MAPLIARAAAGAALAVAIGLALPSRGVGQDATTEPTATRVPTCSDRFPAEGPAGVDLRLGCIVSELVGLYTASSRGEPPRLSAYVVVLAGGIAIGVLLVALGLRLLARRAAARLAPVTPTEWWVCPNCSSVNATSASRCYACGSPPGDGPTMATNRDPIPPSSPGRSSRS
ncbi:MAG TPA: Ran-binding zinc finger domain-containing protein [Candidatus Deferrimicrobiaceae bacterium]|nr:Ran-binding zinc finger domain-containing protein [Candidatus Deferrimicrobiaceae bacterium]